eukprot:Tbor_TRINITY_DN3710_c0_g1::TRINITY_DN3710_c0_g1_i1::g.2465::m.2465
MTAVKCTVTLDNLIQHLEVDIDCTVLEVNPTLFPKVKPGMIVSSINDISVRDRTDLKVEMLAISQNPKTAKAPIVMLFEVRDAAEDSNTPISLCQQNKSTKNKKRDELDFDSDEEKPPEPKFSVDSGKQVILNAVNKTAPGACILLLCERYNPAYQIEEAARSRDITVMHIDAVVRVKSRLPMKEFGSTLRKSLERGVWMFIENASKSITLLQELVECIIAAKEKKSIHTNSRVLLLCEPHPYFPPQLLEGAVTLRMRMAPGEQVLEETIKDPRSKLQLMQGTNQSSSKGPNLPTTSMKKRTVKIASVVEVVPLETSSLFEMSASAVPNPDNDDDHREGLHRVAKYRFGPNEKLISLCSVGEDRFAVGTSSGYVVVLDCNGLPLIQYRPHKACIWDLAFASTYDFSTASEDGSSSVFTYHLVQQTLEATSVASFQSDVFALTYTRPSDPSSAVLSGGLSATICVLHSDRKSSSFIPASTSIQAMRAITTRNLVLFGGGSGSCALVDPERGITVETATKHTRKVPAVSTYENMALSGSFDKTLRVWDIRSGMHCSHNLVMPDVLTATAISGNYTAACSGSSIYLWDLRNFNQILAVKNKAWSGLTRGLVMDHTKKLLATASVDGIARFWKFDQ